MGVAARCSITVVRSSACRELIHTINGAAMLLVGIAVKLPINREYVCQINVSRHMLHHAHGSTGASGQRDFSG